MRATGSMTGYVLMLVFCLSLTAAAFPASQDTANEETQYCLTCHAKKGTARNFPDGSALSTFVEPKAFGKSVHGTLGCTACHQDFSGRRHPERVFRSRLQYQVKESRRCRECHPDSSIRSRTVHESLFRKETGGEAIVCTHCHSAHAVGRVVAGRLASSEEQYCMGCHSHERRQTFINGESISVAVHIEEIRGSLHRSLGCSDCHFGFTADEHPRKRFRSEREYRHASSEICRRCHYDRYAKVAGSAHYAALSVGRLDAPACVDCHGTHAVSSPGADRLAVVRKCEQCHREVFTQYARSVHGNALFNDRNRDVAICTDCHSSHAIRDTARTEFHDYIPDKCSTCHANAATMGKYGLSTDVVKTYLADFHGMTLSLHRKELRQRYGPAPVMAVCTDCHGTHEIARASGSDTKAMKTKLLKRCTLCHPGASENFPDAWLSHYKPSLAVAPMVFITEELFKILLPLTIIGLVFQILLDVWRYLKNR